MKRHQLTISELVAKIKVLETKKSHLSRRLEASGVKIWARKSDTTMPEILLPHVNTINILGKKFGVMTCVWPDSSDFHNLVGWPMVPLTGILRFQNAEMKKLAIIAEIYNSIPPKIHPFLQGEPKFGEIVRLFILNFITYLNHYLHKFKSAAGTIRSSSVHVLCKTAPFIFDLKAEYFHPNFDQRSIPGIADLLGYDPSSKKIITRWSSILYPKNVSAQNKHAFAFRNEALAKVGICYSASLL